MVALRSLFALLTVFLSASVTTGNSSELFDVRDYQLTTVCEETVEKHHLKTFEVNDLVSTPEVAIRQPEAELYVTEVFFKAYFRGLLFQRGDKAVLHCYQHYYRPNFILLERSERWMIFENGARQATEAHIHSYISCGSNCGYSRYESITFFDIPKVPKEEEGWLHSVPLRPLYWLGGDTHPNEYPSRWFRSYLTEEERIVFDRIIEEG